jgi:hypothetical protein
MRIGLVWILASCVCLSRMDGAEVKPVLDVAPTLAELGEGWTTNVIISVLDTQAQPAGAVSKRQVESRGMTNRVRATGKKAGRMGWVRIEYGRGDLVLNSGAYFVSIQRWANTNALEKAWRGWRTRPDYTAWRGPPIGEGCYWTEDEKFHGLTFRRGLFHVVITCGSQSDHAGLFELADVIDVKILGRPVAKAEESEQSTR